MDVRFDVRNTIAGGLIVATGIGAVVMGSDYSIGTAREMGPGYFPVWLGAILICLGLIIMAKSLRTAANISIRIAWGDVLPPLGVAASMAAFIIVGARFGFLPASILLIFASALLDRTNGYKGALALAVSVSVIGLLGFIYLLSLPLDLIVLEL